MTTAASTMAIRVRFMMAVLLLAGSACAPAPPPDVRHEYSRALMGTEARVVLYARDEETARCAAAAALDRIAALEQVLSDWRESSEISILARFAGAPARPVSDDLFRVLSRALALAEASGGAFDPTVGALVLAWRAARKRAEVIGPEALAAARALVGWRMLEVTPGPPPTARMATAGMRLDLGGIGKGFAAQEALAVLDRLGVRRALVAVAGDVVCGDPPPNRDAWEIAVGKGGGTLSLVRAAISTSGDAEQFVEIAGVRYSHVVDPRSGAPLRESPWVTVVAADGATADGLATAVSVMGEIEGRALVARFAGARLVAFGGL